MFSSNTTSSAAANLTVTFSSQLSQHSQMSSAGAQSLSLSSNVPLLNYQPGLYQQATINIPRPPQLCTQTEPFQQTLIVCPPTIQGLQTSSKPSGFPVRMDSSAPLGPQNQNSQSLHIQPGMLAQASLDPLLQGWPAGTQQILIPSTWQQMPGMALHNPGQNVVPAPPMGASDSHGSGWRGRHGSQFDGVGHAASRPQQGKRAKARHAESRARPVSSATALQNPPAGDQSQPIIISDTPSPAVSIITIHSDSEDEDDRKFPAGCSGTSQRTNVISCVTVHDSDSSTSSPLSTKTPPLSTKTPPLSTKTPPLSTKTPPLSTKTPPLSTKTPPLSTKTPPQPAQPLAVIVPSVKSQPAESSDQATSGSGKPKKASSRTGDSNTDRHQRNTSSRSQPLNLSQVQQSVMSSSLDPTGSSIILRRQPTHEPTYPPPVSSHSSFLLHENPLFSSAPNLYAYPASAALASVSQAVDQMQGGRVGGAFSSLALLQKTASLGVSPAQYGNQSLQQGVLPFHHASATYQRKLNQFPYL
ncbi:hypothetical protein CgunFtcFv8_001099 [Champsocephalus gunnari]|uniref:Uncharacterized protein n=1 Tax=Champsocephalus gunnari TaxID=52237 RepID=A0AAN8HQI2_CHAGU|nr:hypothetical protein CgunFtcFv8_001099 [Champsocephalus gunnari]